MSDYADLNPKLFLENILQSKFSEDAHPFPTGEPLYTYQISQLDY